MTEIYIAIITCICVYVFGSVSDILLLNLYYFPLDNAVFYKRKYNI